MGIYENADLKRKLADVGRMQYILVPARLVTPAASNPFAGYNKSLREWFLYPAKLPCRAHPLDPWDALKKFIAQNYVTAEEVGASLILRRKS